MPNPEYDCQTRNKNKENPDEKTRENGSRKTEKRKKEGC